MDNPVRNTVFWIVIVLTVLFFYKLFGDQEKAEPTFVDSGIFVENVRAGKVAKVTLPEEARLSGEYLEKDARGRPLRFVTPAPGYRDLIESLTQHRVEIDYRSSKRLSIVGQVLGWLPVVAVIAIWVLFMRRLTPGKPPA
jgi:cell division protease FtsH